LSRSRRKISTVSGIESSELWIDVMWRECLARHLEDRATELEERRRSGAKVVAYLPGGYVPEELVYAAGAIPLCLLEGGSSAAVETGSSIAPTMICPFARAQLGERVLKRNPYYCHIDMLVAPTTCQHLRKVAEIWEYYGELKIFKLGVPHQHSGAYQLEYYAAGLNELKESLERLTGIEITSERMRAAVDLCNQVRELLKRLSFMRRSSRAHLSSSDFVRLNHASFYADPAFMLEVLRSISSELEAKSQEDRGDRPRLLLISPNMARGDYRILKLVEESGGEIVMEEVCEGLRDYWHAVEYRYDFIEALAEAYLKEKLPCAFMRYCARERLEFALRLIREFNVSGVIWYQLQSCETYDSESYFFSQKFAERNIPMLVLESDYGDADTSRFRTRIDAFIELVRGDAGE
jgi:benzoyl-CoA reductase/2-hydroxyglutaryl-CoA dehydratase subunit BcrC/BadD/HgdB